MRPGVVDRLFWDTIFFPAALFFVQWPSFFGVVAAQEHGTLPIKHVYFGGRRVDVCWEANTGPPGEVHQLNVRCADWGSPRKQI